MRLLIAIALVILFITIINIVYKRLWHKNLDITISFDKSILYEQESNKITEIISNGKLLPLPVLQIKFSISRFFLFEKEENTAVTDNYYRSEFFTVYPYRKITRYYNFICSKRGLYSLNDLDIICNSILLDKKLVGRACFQNNVLVLPAPIPDYRIPSDINALIGETEKRLHFYEDPFTFAGLRDYQTYDSIKNINWKATARADYPQVNILNTTFSKKVVLLLNSEVSHSRHEDDIFEHSIKISICIARKFITKHIPVSLYTNGKDIISDTSPSIDEGSDLRHIRTIETALARLDINKKPDRFVDFMKERINSASESTEYYIISNERRNDTINLYKEYLAKGFKIHFIIPEYDSSYIENDFCNDQYTRWFVNP